MTQPWRATAVQMPAEVVWAAADRAEARRIIDRNVEAALALIDQAMQSDPAPRLVLLPEYVFTGMPNGPSVAEWLELACYPVPGPITEPLQRKAAEHGIYLGGNQFEVDPEWGERFFNSSFLISPAGDVVLNYRRIHTAMYTSPQDILDDYLVRYGWEGLWPVVDTELGRIGMVPCGELQIPEAVRTMAFRGVEVLLHPTWEVHTPIGDAARLHGAAANAMTIISANVSGALKAASGGEIDNPAIGGGSRIVDHTGTLLAVETGREVGTHVSALIDVEAGRALRSDTSMANPLIRLRLETLAPTYARTSIYPPNSFIDLPMETFADAQVPTAQALTRLQEMGIAPKP